MMENFAFTLYELFGYLLPGAVALLGFLVCDWAFFVPRVPLGISTFQAGVITWTSVVIASYLLGHGMQAVGNVLMDNAEDSVLESNKGSAPDWMKERARQTAGEILQIKRVAR